MPPELTLSLAPTTSAGATARAAVRDGFGDTLDRDDMADLQLVVSELVTNAFDAEASLVDVAVVTNALDAIMALTVFDNGVGMTRVELTDRFGLVGVRSDTKTKIGRFGVGRWGVFRLGRRSGAR